MRNGSTCSLPVLDVNDLDGNRQLLLLMNLSELNTRQIAAMGTSHRVNYYQVILCDNGCGHIWIDSNRFELKEKGLYAIAKNQIVKYAFNAASSGKALFFSDEFIYQNPTDLGWINTLRIFNSFETSLAAQLAQGEYEELMGLYNKIEEELNADSDFARAEILNSLLKAFLFVAERNKLKRNLLQKNKDRYRNHLKEFIQKLEENYKQIRVVNYYADLLNITPKKLNSIVFNSFGKTAKKIIEERILLETKRLLTHTDYSVKEIGSNLGFTDPTNFNKFFKKYVGSTPVYFRNVQKAESHNQ